MVVNLDRVGRLRALTAVGTRLHDLVLEAAGGGFHAVFLSVGGQKVGSLLDVLGTSRGLSCLTLRHQCSFEVIHGFF